jgi:hypothetical protein
VLLALIALALTMGRRWSRTSEQAETDPLTGLGKLRSGEDPLADERVLMDDRPLVGAEDLDHHGIELGSGPSAQFVERDRAHPEPVWSQVAKLVRSSHERY